MGALTSLGQLFRACFAGDMLIDVEGGKKRADAIQVGDRVWARDEFDPEGPLALKEVEEVFVRSAPIWNLHIGGQIIRSTAEHPFYANGRGWVPLAMLAIGDVLHTRDGALLPVTGVADSGEVTTVYNWRIADYHTYYVSTSKSGAALWAHNASYNIPENVGIIPYELVQMYRTRTAIIAYMRSIAPFTAEWFQNFERLQNLNNRIRLFPR